MKTIAIGIFSLITFWCRGQQVVSYDSTVEIQLRLIEERKTGQMALAIALINHSDKDIYIPNISGNNFHLYAQTDSGWREMNIFTHRLYANADPQINMHEHFPDIGKLENEVTKRFRDSSYRSYLRQDSIYQQFYGGEGDTKKPHEKHFRSVIFLKGKETIPFYQLYPLDFKGAEFNSFSISYGTDTQDSTRTQNAATTALKLPGTIFNFSRYIPGRIRANSIYFFTYE